MAFPVYVGKMIYVGHWAASASQSGGSGRLNLDPEFLLGVDDLRHDPRVGGRVVFRDIARNNDQRTFVSALIPGLFPCGNKTPILTPLSRNVTQKLLLSATITSLAFDWPVRQRVSGTTLNWHIVESLVLPMPAIVNGLSALAARVVLSGMQFADEWLRLSQDVPRPNPYACSIVEHLRIIAMLDAVVAALMNLSVSDLRHALAECDHPCGETAPKRSKGFWRVDKEKDPELRQTVLTLTAFHDLEGKIQAAGGDRANGIESFLAQNQGEGWMLPETLRLADYDLGHDGRAKHPQPVASRLGPAFYDWQLVQNTDESWRDCHLHARNLLGDEEYKRLVESLQKGVSSDIIKASPADGRARHDAPRPCKGRQVDLFE